MAEAIISRRGNKGESAPRPMTTTTISENSSFKVPHTGNYFVRIFGGGGGSGGTKNAGGGGGGWMNNGEFSLAVNSSISVIIGRGGDGPNVAGGTSAFGTYLSANGGSGGSDTGNGGNGGSGGGSGYNYHARIRGGSVSSSMSGPYIYAGRGYQFGGGGGGNGHGGIWGGGGGGIVAVWQGVLNWNNGPYSNRVTNDWSDINNGRGGTYGGNGGFHTSYINGNDGTNTMNETTIDNDLRGPGNGGKGKVFSTVYGNKPSGGGGGGGYGGCGGSVSGSVQYESDYSYGATSGGYRVTRHCYSYHSGGAGGGGGYGANGGNANSSSMGSGGGGGYGGKGGDGGNTCGGGGGGYGSGASYSSGAGFGGGGSGSQSGGSGICIIQWYE